MVSIFDVPYRAARRYLATGAPVYLTVNPVECHGPHLSLHNDRLISMGLARDMYRANGEERGWEFLLGADLEVGVEPCPGAGSRFASHGAVNALVVEACRALADLGATKVVLLTFHGSPLHNLALDAGVRYLTRRGVKALAPFNLLLAELLAVPAGGEYDDILAKVPDPEAREQVRDEIAVDFHAGFLETSLSLHYAPDSVSPDHATLPPCPPIRPHPALAAVSRAARRLGAGPLARELAFAANGLGWYALRPFPGYTGRPHLASTEVGRLLAERIAGRFSDATRAVFDGAAKAPPPIMGWLGALSLGGRIGILPKTYS